MIDRAGAAPDGSAGFTLIEMMVALLLFALISMAGMGLVETVIGVERHTSERALRLAEIQRALFLVRADFGQLVEGPLRKDEMVLLIRSGAGRRHVILYMSDGAGLHRVIDGSDRLILPGVEQVQWRFYKHGMWQAEPATENDPSRSEAVEFTGQLPTSLNSTNGALRQVITLPAEP
ncbi:MAG: prepilin-type N-terminal cleavage/methylation domain-containing protein [Novosphingobium sp.]|nr:prepilin-type N-terminal cleavage/methylation domain-containing protein [Novosphingobium sp.]